MKFQDFMEDIFQNLKKFSKFCKSKYAVTVGSGTTALHLALVSLGIKKVMRLSFLL